MRALVLGYGRSGKAAEALLKAQGAQVVVLANDERDRIEGEGFGFAVVSPGIALAHPWIVEAKRRGIPLKSELQLGCEELKRQGWKLLAITGSKGKSSVVKVVEDAINLAGEKAVACGNYGVPVCEVARGCGDRNVAAPAVSRTLGCASSWEARGCGDRNVAAPAVSRTLGCASTEGAGVGAATFLSPQEEQPAEGGGVGVQPSASETAEGRAFLSPQPGWAVVEVSSFMMETTELPADTFEAAAILNLQEDHLDRHGSVEVYHGLKRKLLTFARKGFVAAATGMSPPLWAGSYFDNDVLAGNAAIAVELMRVAGLDDAAIAKAFREFRPLPHRMNLVAEVDGVCYIDDSKATSIAALIAGVEMASSGNRTSKQSNNRTILLVAGGLPKGDDPKVALPTLTERVKKVYLIGQSAELFFAAWKDAVDCEICGTMDRAVEAARREAEKGETVLLSPGTASFDQFKSYGERGEVFARLVKKEGQPK